MALLPLLPLKLSPSSQMPRMSVSYRLNGATSKVIETDVTSRLEAVLSRLSNVSSISSRSDNGSGSITIRLDKHADMDMARFEASMLIRQVWQELPAGTSYPTIRVSKTNENQQGPFIVYTINAPVNSAEIQETAQKIFKSAFANVDGISDVNISGGEPMEWIVEYDNDEAKAAGITENDISRAIALEKQEINIGDYRLSTGVPDSVFLFNDISIATADTQCVELNRIAHLKHQEQAASGYYRINGLNSIYLQLTADDDANQIDVRNRAVEVIEQQKKLLPPNYELHVMYDATEYISQELENIYYRSGLTTLILLIFIFITSLSLRSVFVTTTSLIVTLTTSVIAYYLLDVELHTYSLASITISLNLIIDNIIVMANHWRREHNLKAILPIAAATLTTAGALSIIYFLDDELKLSLMDFATVLIVNMFISMLVSLFIVPALIELTADEKDERKKSLWKLRRIVRLRRAQIASIRFIRHHNRLSTAFLILIFGIPTFLMPDKIDGEGFWTDAYNKVFGSEVYTQKIRPWVDKALGGTLRLFAQDIGGSSSMSNTSEVVLYVHASMPNGSTLDQMNTVVRKMESYISTLDGIRMFETNIRGARSADISIRFTEATRNTSYPYVVKSRLTEKALQLGGGSWSIYGLQDYGFSNDVKEQVGSYMIQLYGYNYEQLLGFAEDISRDLTSHKRIREVSCNSHQVYWKEDYSEFVFKLRMPKMAEQDVSPRQFFSAIKPAFNMGSLCGRIWNGSEYEGIKVAASESKSYDVWSLRNMPIIIGDHHCKLSELCELTRQTSPQSIEKKNQEYQLVLQYEYIGSSKGGDRVYDEILDKYQKLLPTGYTIKGRRGYFWGHGSEDSLLPLLLLIIAIIFVVSTILFDSLLKPLVIMGTIPISFVGLFLTFYLFDINFDQGGFAAMVLLCGITVNASIYIVNEFQRNRKRQPNWSLKHCLLKAYDVKTGTILLTILSTVLGFIPFIIDSNGGFWFSLAAGTMGGLIMSVVGIFLFLPLFIKLKSKKLSLS